MRFRFLKVSRSALFGILLGAIVSVALSAPPSSAQDYKPAQAAIDSKDWDSAISQLRTILTDKPDPKN